MTTPAYAYKLHTAIDVDSLLPAMIATQKGEVEAVTWGDGPAVVALHGAMGGYDQGILLARTVTCSRFKFVAISRPGYLRTPLRIGRTPQEQADLCAAVLDALGIKRSAMMAISGGGPAALQFALRYPDRCKALVMISACSQQLDVPIPFRWNVMKLLARIPGFTERMRKRIQQGPAKALERAVPQPALRDRLMCDRESADLLLRLQTGVLDGMQRRIPGTDNDIRVTRSHMSWPLEQIRTPMLIVHGMRDSVVPYPQAELLAKRVPGAELLSIEDGEHVAIFTHRAQIRERVDAFLSALGE